MVMGTPLLSVPNCLVEAAVAPLSPLPGREGLGVGAAEALGGSNTPSEPSSTSLYRLLYLISFEASVAFWWGLKHGEDGSSSYDGRSSCFATKKHGENSNATAAVRRNVCDRALDL